MKVYLFSVVYYVEEESVVYSCPRGTATVANKLALTCQKLLDLPFTLHFLRVPLVFLGSLDISYRLNEPPTRRQTAKPSEKKVINCVWERETGRKTRRVYSSLTFSYLSSITARSGVENMLHTNWKIWAVVLPSLSFNNNNTMLPLLTHLFSFLSFFLFFSINNI